MNRHSSWFRGVAQLPDCPGSQTDETLPWGPRRRRVKYLKIVLTHGVFRAWFLRVYLRLLAQKTPQCCQLKSRKKCRSPETQAQPPCVLTVCPLLCLCSGGPCYFRKTDII